MSCKHFSSGKKKFSFCRVYPTWTRDRHIPFTKKWRGRYRSCHASTLFQWGKKNSFCRVYPTWTRDRHIPFTKKWRGRYRSCHASTLFQWGKKKFHSAVSILLERATDIYPLRRNDGVGIVHVMQAHFSSGEKKVSFCRVYPTWTRDRHTPFTKKWRVGIVSCATTS